MTGPTTTVETITAPNAAKMLQSMIQNQRQIKASQVQRLKSDLLNDRWRMTPDAIAFNTNGELCNGQHRLTALVEAAKVNPAITAEFIVIRNLDSDAAMAVTDTGVKRNLKDNLYMRYADIFPGKNSSWFVGLAAITNRAFALDNGLFGGGTPVSTMMQLEWFEENIDVYKSVSIADSVYNQVGLARPVVGACHYLFSRDCDRAKADQFFELVKTGDFSRRDSSINALRRRMEILRRSPSWSTGATTVLQLGLVIKAWNAWLTGAETKLLRFTPEESMPSWTKTYKALND